MCLSTTFHINRVHITFNWQFVQLRSVCAPCVSHIKSCNLTQKKINVLALHVYARKCTCTCSAAFGCLPRLTCTRHAGHLLASTVTQRKATGERSSSHWWRCVKDSARLLNNECRLASISKRQHAHSYEACIAIRFQLVFISCIHIVQHHMRERLKQSLASHKSVSVPLYRLTCGLYYENFERNITTGHDAFLNEHWLHYI